MNCVSEGRSSAPDGFEDQVYHSFDDAKDAFSGIDSFAIGTQHRTLPILSQDADFLVARADDSIASHYDRSEAPFLNYDASRAIVASASLPVPVTDALHLIPGFGYQGTNSRILDAFQQYYPNATLHNRSETGSGPSNALQPGPAVADNLYSSWTQSEIPTSFHHREQSFALPYMSDSTIFDSLIPERPIAAGNGATVAPLANPTGLAFNTGMSNEDRLISPLDIPLMSGANPSLMVFAPFSQQPAASSRSFFTQAVPPYVSSSSDTLEFDLHDATPDASLDDVAVYTPQPGGTVRRRRGRDQVVVVRRRKYPGLAKYFCDACTSDNDFTTAGALNRHIKSKHNGVTFLCTSVGCERMYADESSLRRHRRQCGHT